MARTGLRMMPTFPSSPLKFPYRRLFPVRLQGWRISGRLPANGAHVSRPLGLLPAFVPTAASVGFSPLSVGVRCALKHRHSSGYAALPQGPSLRSGLCCPDPSTLMRPHPTHSQAQCDFTALPAYTPCLRCALPPRRPTTGSVLSLRILSQHVALCDSGESGGCVHPGLAHPPTLAFVPLVQTRHSHPSPQIRFTRGAPFGASLRFACATTC